MVTRDELLEDAEWEARRVCGSGCLLSLKAALSKLEWLDPFSAAVTELRREIRELEGMLDGRSGSGMVPAAAS